MAQHVIVSLSHSGKRVQAVKYFPSACLVVLVKSGKPCAEIDEYVFREPYNVVVSLSSQGLFID